MPQSRRTLFAALALLLLAGLPAAADTTAPTTSGTKLLRFPDIHGDQVVFVYGGDLWKAPAAGGTATRLTAHPGLEVFPKFSPDGKWIAFTGQYDGDEQVYVMPSGGGVPRQLTYYPARGPLPDRWGFDNQVYGWTPDGEAHPVPLDARMLGTGARPALHRLHRRRPADGPSHAGLGRGRLSAGRQERRLFAAVPRLPHLEALRGRLGAGSLHLRSGYERNAPSDEGHSAPTATQCGSATRSSSPPTAPARSSSTASIARPTRRKKVTSSGKLGRPLAQLGRRAPHRLRARRRAASPRREERQVDAARHHRAR